MKTVYYKGEEIPDIGTCVATIGQFDGVHRGHQFLIARLVETARAEGRQSMVITFDEHPRRVLQSDYMPQRLSTLQGKLRLLGQTAVDYVVVLHFTPQMAALSAQEFMYGILLRHLHVGKLFIGYDHRFGHNRAEGFDDYVRYGREMGISVVRSEALTLHGVNVSSSVIRSFLKEGEVALARECLGYTYYIIGRVVGGYHEGRKMGFPTANLEVDHAEQLVPAPGVYAVRARIEGTDRMLPGMMNIGTRPTFDGTRQTLEVHLLDFQGNLYGQQLLVAFVRRVRAERKFASPHELARQLELDKQEIIHILNENE